MSPRNEHGASGPNSPEFVATRVIDAPRAVVFLAFRDPALLARWWGPTGFTNTFHEFDFRPGGTWRFTMHGPDGSAFEIENRFVEIVPPGRIAVHHPERGHEFRITVTLDEQADRTRITWTMVFESADEAEHVREAVVAANEQNLDRLQALISDIA